MSVEDERSPLLPQMRLQPPSEHPHGMPDAEFDALFTPDKGFVLARRKPWAAGDEGPRGAGRTALLRTPRKRCA